jgi:SAM-dependent methyltransferase
LSFHSDKAAQCGEPSYVWRAGQQRRLHMILDAAGSRISGHVLENGCGVGMYVQKLAAHCSRITGLEYELDRARQAAETTAELSNARILSAAGEYLPFPKETFSFILSHEVLEHVQDDRQAVSEMARVLKPGGRIVVFVPNRGYPFETHGVYWRGEYRFGNIPLVNYLPRHVRDRLAPHVRVYSTGDLKRLFAGLPLRLVHRTVIFGAYDNIIARRPALGRLLRAALQGLEGSPLRVLGLSHFWVLEKLAGTK